MNYINNLLRPIFDEDVFEEIDDPFGFENVTPILIYNKFEGQIDTGKMMLGLIKKATEKNILIVNSSEITGISDKQFGVNLQVNSNLEIQARKVFIATNGFAKQFLNQNIKPARAQVLITKPIPNLKLKGTFHLNRGYYYFRNRSEEHTSELQSRPHLVCRLLLEK